MLTPYRRNGTLSRSRSRFVSQVRSSLARAAGRRGGMLGAARSARRSLFSRNRQRRQPSTGQGVTTQYDSRLIYRKRSMPRFKKRRWRRFSKKVHAVAEKSWGTLTFVFNNSATFTNTQSGAQGLADMGLYGWQSSSSAFNDLKNMKDIIDNAAMTTDTGLPVGDSSKIFFQSGVMDLTLRNTSTFTADATPALDSLAKLEVDIYECTQRQQAEDSSAVYSNPRGLFAVNTSKTLPIGGGAQAEVAINSRGATPFDMTYILGRFGVKIWKKSKYTLGNGEQMTYQIRDPKRRVTELEAMGTGEGYNKPGWTRWLLIVFKIPPGLTVGTTAGTYQENLTIGLTRKYSLKISNYSEDRTAYLVA